MKMYFNAGGCITIHWKIFKAFSKLSSLFSAFLSAAVAHNFLSSLPSHSINHVQAAAEEGGERKRRRGDRGTARQKKHAVAVAVAVAVAARLTAACLPSACLALRPRRPLRHCSTPMRVSEGAERR